ncbi:hypothetical protein LZD49_28015 [Dyadobacter sp. CY261]|uniref:hypothetical protein n=1 Tax=Dyadobacter sp. CY261 TaxID=2907203 RepID=UPI001F37095C|nr:hypothetical protein [Dyadobacter sp. CY261]MCF0074362.1 hypothetical protein [Dyadobacter sp. CY261]
MKRLFHILLIFCIAFCTHCKNRDELNVMDKEGLGLYWHHEANVERGRHLLMSFINVNASTDKADYKFEYQIQGRVIDVRLVEKISKGKCQVFPGPNGDQCQSWGNIYIPETALSEGTYKFRLQTGKAIVTADLIVGHDQYELKVPANSYFTNNIPVVYAIPRNIVFGSVLYKGDANEPLARALIDDLMKAGLKPAVIPTHPYSYLAENNQTHLSNTFWEPDNHLINLVFSWEGDFKKVVEICKKHFELSKKQIGIGLWNSDYMEQITADPNGGVNAFTR